MRIVLAVVAGVVFFAAGAFTGFSFADRAFQSARQAEATFELAAANKAMVLAYARLSDIAQGQGATNKAQWLRNKALELCPRMKLSECSIEAILKMARNT